MLAFPASRGRIFAFPELQDNAIFEVNFHPHERTENHVYRN